MPKIPNRDFHLGFDPGANGGIAVISKHRDVLCLEKMPDTAWELKDLLVSIKCSYPRIKACIEQIDPRPTFVPRLGKSVILKSTCLIFGDFMQGHMGLITLQIPTVVVRPQVWQPALNCPKKGKGKTSAEHKRDLKDVAIKLFQNTKVTLWSADALLLAEYCRTHHA